MPQVAAYPFVNITIDTRGLRPVAQRAPGVLCLVGPTNTAGGNAGSAAVGAIVPIEDITDARRAFGQNAAGNLERTPLYNAFEIALQQDPRPSRLYGIRSASNSVANLQAALRTSEAAADVTVVSLADEHRPDRIAALRAHVDTVAGNGIKRLGVAMINPGLAPSDNWVADRVSDPGGDYRQALSTTGRMILVAARGAEVVNGATRPADVAAAAAAAIAGQPPHVSPLLKPVRGFSIPKASQFRAAEIIGLSRAGVIPVIDPVLMPGESLHFAEGTTYTSDPELIYADIVRVLDDIEFRLKAGLIGLVGDARITRAGLVLLQAQIDGILRPLMDAQVIDSFAVQLPLLAALSLPPEARTPGDVAAIAAARANRQVPLAVSINYGPAVHRLDLQLALRF